MIETAVVESLQELASRRQAQGLSVGEVAQRLRFAPRQIEAIERGDWDALPGRAFARGALRSYGRLLGADVTSLLAQMGGGVDELRPAATLATPMPRVHTFPAVSSAGRPGLLWGLLGMGAVIGLIAFFAKDRDLSAIPGWFRTVTAERTGDAAAEAPAPVVTPDTTPAPVAAVPAGPPAAGTPAVVPLPESVGATPAPLVSLPGVVSDSPAVAGVPPAPTASAPATPADAAAGPGTGPLRIVLSQDAWVEVRQADGRVLHSGLTRAGSDRSFDGTAPLSVTIGNAHTARVEWKGAAVDLAPRIRGSVARLKLD